MTDKRSESLFASHEPSGGRGDRDNLFAATRHGPMCSLIPEDPDYCVCDTWPPSPGRPRLLDLFCGAGGCTAGYQDAGFYVVGVDVDPQPNYCGDAFVQADVMEILNDWHFNAFDAIHASPPCQRYSIAQNASKNADAHPDLVDPVREALLRIGKPYVIENVPGAPLRDAVTLCGKSFGLNVRRHRLFETNWPAFGADCPAGHGYVVSVFGGGSKGPTDPETGKRTFVPITEAKKAMGIDWMVRDELSQAIPPVYTHFIGLQLRAYLASRALLVTEAAA